jgi:hypothetical protein
MLKLGEKKLVFKNKASLGYYLRRYILIFNNIWYFFFSKNDQNL